MRRTAAILLAALVVVGTLGVVPTTGVAQQTTTDGTTGTATPTDGGATETNTDDTNATAPGDVLEGVVGVQEAELAGAIENRTFGIKVAQAATADAKAEVVAGRLARIRERLAALEERKQELQEARASGSVSTSEYRSEIATLAARSNNTRQLLARSANVSRGLPSETLRANGINVTAIRTLRERANRLTGPEVAEIARSIAGPSVAQGAEASERRGPPQDAGAGADRSGDRTAGGARTGNRTAGGGRGAETPDRGSESGDSGNAGGGAGGGSGAGGAGGSSGGAGGGSGGPGGRP